MAMTRINSVQMRFFIRVKCEKESNTPYLVYTTVYYLRRETQMLTFSSDSLGEFYPDKTNN
jgi:hypothetical protein